MATTIGMGAKNTSTKKEDNEKLNKAKAEVAELKKENEKLKNKINELEKTANS